MQMLIALAFCLSLLSAVVGQLPGLGPCPKVDVVKNFNANKYLGRWYEYERYPFIFESGGSCIYADYGLRSDGSISVYNAQIDILKNPAVIEGVADIVGNAKLEVSFPDEPITFGASSPYWVLGTDYTNYAVVFSCSEYFGAAHARVVWVLTRSRNPSKKIISQAHKVIQQNKLSLVPLSVTDQQNCPNDIAL